MRLKHPNIMPLLDFGISQESIPFLVMEYAPLGTLRDHYPRGTRVPLPTVINYTRQIAAALQYAHERHLVHRDVKPENLLLRANGDVLLSDFGIVTVVHSSRSLSLYLEAGGTPSYMAPEQFEGQARPASDQYSLAVVVYEWLTGRRLFKGTLAELAMQHETEPPPSLIAQVPMLPRAVEQAVFRALEKNPRDRFVTVQAFADALERASQLAIPVHPVLQPSGRVSLPEKPAQQPVLSPGGGIASKQLLSVSHAQTSQISQSPATHSLANTPAMQRKAGGLSRRALIVDLGIVSLTLIGGSLVWRACSQPILVSSKSGPARTSGAPGTPGTPGTPRPTPSPIPLGSALYTYRQHTALVNAVAWSPDSKRIASASDDNTVRVWDATTGEHLLIYRGHNNLVEAVTWSPNGLHLASASFDKTVQVWDASSGARLLTYPGHHDLVRTVAWSPDSKRIASGSGDKTAQVWDAVDGSTLLTYQKHGDLVEAVAWSPDGRYIASCGNDKTVQVWDASSGQHLLTYRGHTGVVDALAWSPDGRYVASGGDDNTVQVWDAATGNHLLTYHRHPVEVRTVAWSPDGRCIASGGSDKTVQVWGSGWEKVTNTKRL